MSDMKDAVLAKLDQSYNVANFFSIDKDEIRYHNLPLTTNTWRTLLAFLMSIANNGISIRSFTKDKPSGNPFYHQVTSYTQAEDTIVALQEQGYIVIVNESSDDAGCISGVLRTDIMEIGFHTTPRIVGTPDVTTVTTSFGLYLIRQILGVDIHELATPGKAIEFSVYKEPFGRRLHHVVVWEASDCDSKITLDRPTIWPNKMSDVLGDKLYGLLVADYLKLNVPQTIATFRDSRLKNMMFAVSSEPCLNFWTRTCPCSKFPGSYTTARGVLNAAALMDKEDPHGLILRSVIYQHEVKSEFSGAMITKSDGSYVIEGVDGFGDDFMQGTRKCTLLPEHVTSAVELVGAQIKKYYSSFTLEWGYAAGRVWVFQLNTDVISPNAGIVVPGDADAWYSVSANEDLRDVYLLIERLKNEVGSFGIKLDKHVGFTSHIADVLRKHNIPTRIQE